MDSTFITGILAVILGIIPTPPNAESFYAIVSNESSELSRNYGNCAVPEHLEPMLGELDDEGDPSRESLAAYRRSRKSIYSPTISPSGSIRLPGDFERSSALLLAYKSFHEYDSIFGDLLEFSMGQGDVHVLVLPTEMADFQSLLERRSIPRSEIIIHDDVPFDSVWMRDYGPTPIITARGMEFVDGRYFDNCLLDDAVPTELSRHFGNPRVYRPNIRTEGGNLLSNGEGLCITSTYLVTQNESTEPRMAQVLRRFYGCQDTIFLEPLEGNVVRHVDIFLTFTSSHDVLLGEFTPEQDFYNAMILEENAARLSSWRSRTDGRGLRIERVPMPNRTEAAIDDLDGPLVRTYLNMLQFNESVFVPVYDEERTFEEEALARIQRAFPSKNVIAVRADEMAIDAGTLHCISQTLPAVGR